MNFSRYPWWRRWFGSRSERMAGKFLTRLGYRVLAYNQSDPRGELDLLALDQETLVVVEVRSSSGSGLHRIANSVNEEKQQRIIHATMRFLSRRGMLNRLPVRFDVIAISWPPEAAEPQLLHLRGAFQSAGRFQLHS